MLVYCVNAPLLGLNVRWDCDKPNKKFSLSNHGMVLNSNWKQPVVKRPTENESSIALIVISYL
jgi:hypothetical protein